MKRNILILVLALSIFTLKAQNENIYLSTGTEVIFSGADVYFNGTDVNTNARFTIFFHLQQQVDFDLSNIVGLYTGFAFRNVGLIMEDLYQNVGYDVDQLDPDYNKNTKIKHRSYALGFPIAIKLGSIDDGLFAYGGFEYAWMFHYKQKKFIDDEKYKFKEWGSDRVNPWIPSWFVGVQFPGGFNLKFKYYLKDFLNQDFVGQDFGQDVDYSQFESTGIWYISFSTMIKWSRFRKAFGKESYNETAFR